MKNLTLIAVMATLPAWATECRYTNAVVTVPNDQPCPQYHYDDRGRRCELVLPSPTDP